MSTGLSKSRYCRGIQCPKMLWMDKHMPEQAADMGLEAVMTTGIRVGDVARGYFGSYSLVQYDTDKSAMAEKTKHLMEEGAENIAEASFINDGLYCAVDILHRDDDGYDIVEVKSSTGVKDIYIDDVAFQYYLLTKCGVSVKKVYIMYIDNSYIRYGDLELDKLFALEDRTEEAVQKAADVEKNVAEIRACVDTGDEPERDIGPYCHAPYDCAYYGYCARRLPQPSIFDVRNLKRDKFELYHQGIVSFEDII